MIIYAFINHYLQKRTTHLTGQTSLSFIIRMAKSVEQYLFDTERKITLIIEQNLPFERAVKNIVAMQARRIFIEGVKTSGAPIGQYSTDPIYVNPNTGSTPRKTREKTRSGLVLEGLEPTRGNPNASLIEDSAGEHIFTARTAHRGVKGTKAGDPHRTTYLAGGYKELRNRTGRRIDRVNITFSNDLLSDFCNSDTARKAVPVKITVHEYHTMLKRPINQLKREGLEKKYGTIFNLMTKEREAFFKTLDFNFRKSLADD